MPSIALLDRFGFLSLTGKESLKFLQGYTTCDLDTLSPSDRFSINTSSIGATLNIQGRVVSSYRIIATQDGFILRMPKQLVPVTQNFLQKYIVFSRAQMENLSSELACYGLLGEEPVANALPSEALEQVKDCYLVDTEDSCRVEIWCGKTWKPTEGMAVIGENDWTLAEIQNELAWIDRETTDQFLPQMLGYHNLGGISFQKGCYLGQEIVARMQYRGELKRKLHRARINSGVIPAPGQEILNAEGTNAGEVIAAAKDKDQIQMLVVLKEGQTGYSLTTGEPLTLSY